LRQKNRPLSMAEFITADSLWELIITFISLLELTRQRKVTLLQEGLFQPIMVMLREIEEQEEVPGDG
jgi:chromatin segregation and condensation protein Rec8/ScpA/Scc1 (kleisin family)